MKTAISLPDDAYERVTRRAKELGVSRSEFFVLAALSYLDELDAQSVTSGIDAALDSLEGEDASSADAVAAGRARLVETDDEW